MEGVLTRGRKTALKKIYEGGIANNVSKVGFSEEEVFVKERM